MTINITLIHCIFLVRWHCPECTDFDLCIPCYEKIGHQHTMKKLGLGIMIDPPSIKQEGKVICSCALTVVLLYLLLCIVWSRYLLRRHDQS